MPVTKVGCVHMADWLVAGAGIGGLAAALALQDQGVSIEVWEQAEALTEVGAGIQMGPNVTRILNGWGLASALEQVAVRPQALLSLDAATGQVLGRLDLGDAERRYGAPYMTIHRADLHALLRAALSPERVQMRLGCAVSEIEPQGSGPLRVTDDRGVTRDTPALIGADGLWSRVREQVCADAGPVPTGHWAYRALLPTRLLSPRWREPWVQVWMAPGLHVVHYPVRSGEWLNVVVLIEAPQHPAQKGWDASRDPDQIRVDVQGALRGLCHELHDVLRPVEVWRAWSLWGRPELRGADQMARGRVALLGDAAHPMLPYLAQGAGMAIEDAWQLARTVSQRGVDDVQGVFSAYAQARWSRNARVQRQSRRNGQIFHAQGPLAWLRNTALRLAAAQFMDQPWLYGPQPQDGAKPT